jgi:DNA-binding GntR family transcriptional regulator
VSAIAVSKSTDKAYAAIRDMIVDGRFQPGDRLSEELLSAEIGVSRTPVREALRRLEADYFVAIKANRGARVLGWESGDVEDLFQLRALVEGFAARCAADRASAEDVAAMRAEISEIDRALTNRARPDIERFLAANSRFHTLLSGAARNSRVSEIIKSLVAQAVVVRTARRFSKEDLERSNFHHREMVDAIEARDGALAETIMRTHILSAGQAFKPAQRASVAKAGGRPRIDTTKRGP